LCRSSRGVKPPASRSIQVLKHGAVSEFLANPALHSLLDRTLARFESGTTIAITGHSRLATNGAQSDISVEEALQIINAAPKLY